MAEGTEFNLKNKKQLMILVSLEASTMQTTKKGKTSDQILKPGSFYVIRKRHSFSIKNTRHKNVPFILVELPPA
jgi:hypothetical protein